jgi:hypothetical protein
MCPHARRFLPAVEELTEAIDLPRTVIESLSKLLAIEAVGGEIAAVDAEDCAANEL